MNTQINFEIPESIAAGLALGKYERVGGVIRDASNGQVVTWLREIAVSPLNPNSLANTLPSHAGKLLSMTGGVASILNLGATVAFGITTLKKLESIETNLIHTNAKLDNLSYGLNQANAKLDILNQKSDIIISKLGELNQRLKNFEWSVDIGFINTFQALDDIKQYQEIELAGELNSAASIAWSCQFLEPNSVQRITRIENAFHTISNVKEKLLLHTASDMQKAIEWMQNYRLGNYDDYNSGKINIDDFNPGKNDFNIDESVIKTLYRVRQTIAACSLAATISAEAGDLYSAESKLAKEQESLSFLLHKLAQLSLSSNDEVYITLLKESYKQIMPAHRLNTWINRFDSKFDGLDEIVDLLREKIMLEGINLSNFYYDKDMKIVNKIRFDSALEDGEDFEKLGFSEEEITDIEELMQQEKFDKEEKIELFPFFSRWDAFKEITPNTHLFFDLIDGIYEDLQRLKGHQAEYKTMLQLDMNIHEYRNLLRIDDIPENKRLAFIMMKKQNL